MRHSLTIAACFYGPSWKDFGRRLINSLVRAIPNACHAWRPVEIKLGLNDFSRKQVQEVERIASDIWTASGQRVLIYWPVGNVQKYPLMRLMFYDSMNPLHDYVMWFDDDSYLEKGDISWWKEVASVATRADLVGQRWKRRLLGKQWSWVQSQPWYNPEVGRPSRDYVVFIQGAWWVARTNLLLQYDYPFPELYRNGGDMMLGELARHRSFRILSFDRGVRINADFRGRHSKSPRRGPEGKSPLVGEDFNGNPLPQEHQKFQCRIKIWGEFNVVETSTFDDDPGDRQEHIDYPF